MTTSTRPVEHGSIVVLGPGCEVVSAFDEAGRSRDLHSRRGGALDSQATVDAPMPARSRLGCAPARHARRSPARTGAGPATLAAHSHRCHASSKCGAHPCAPLAHL